MLQNVGRIAFLVACAAWVTYLSVLILGGVDPAPAHLEVLKVAVLVAVAGALSAFVLAIEDGYLSIESVCYQAFLEGTPYR